MTSKVFSLFAMLLLSSISFAQTGLRVTVTEKENGQPISLAYVNIYDGNNRSMLTTVQTDERGVANVIPEKFPCELEVVALGYEKQTRKFYTAPRNTVVDITLVKKFGTMNEVVVTGTSKPTRLRDALSSYQIISKAQIQAQGAITLDDVLKTQLNIGLQDDGATGRRMGMQGQASSKVKILIDGVPVNGREAGSINITQLNLNTTDRIEIIQGPMSVMYGTDALGGVINIITKKDNKPFAVSLGGYYESIGRYNGDLSLTKKLGRHQFSLTGRRNYFEGYGYIDQPKEFNGHQIQTKRSLYFKPNDQYVGNFAYAYRSDKGFSLQLMSDYTKDNIANRGSLFLYNPFNAKASDEYYKTTRVMNRVLMNGKLGKTGTWQSQNGYSVYYRTRNTYIKDMVTLSEELSEDEGMQDTSRYDDITSRSTYSNKLGIFDYTVGYDITMSFGYSLKMPGKYTDIKDYAAFTNISAPIIKEKLTAQLGLRGSYNTAYNVPLIPSFNLLYKPMGRMQVRASYAKGFRVPTLKEMYLSFIDLNHYIIGNPNLKPETSHHLQGSVSYQLYEKQANYLQLILTGYYNDVYDGIVLVRTNLEDSTSIEHTYGNYVRQKNSILSFQTDGQLNNFHFQLGYSRNFIMPSEFNDALNVGEATASLQYSWRKAGINFSVFNKFYESQPRMTIGIDGIVSYQGKQDAYNMMDISAEKSFFDRKLSVTAGLKNALDVQVVGITGLPSGGGAHSSGASSVGFIPRSIFTSIRYTFE